MKNNSLETKSLKNYNIYTHTRRYLKIVIDAFSSIKLAVALLFCMFVLTLVGTLYQTDYGLYAAQQRYFYSWIFLGFGFIPLPGSLTLLTLFSLNLLISAFRRYRFRIEKMGIILIHYGIIFLLLGSVASFYASQESVVSLLEGEKTVFSEDYYESQLVVWKETPAGDGKVKKEYESYDLKYLKLDRAIEFSSLGVRLKPEYFYKHAEPATFFVDGVESVSGIRVLNYKPLPLKQEQALPGGLFRLEALFLANSKNVLLWEGEGAPYLLADGPAGEAYYMMIRRKRVPLPFEIQLDKFTRTVYYGSEIPKEFSSQVQIIKEGTSIPARIYMNNPLRLDGFTFFQASFAIEDNGSKRSVFATVKNSGYYVPYIASLIITLGIAYHFCYMGVSRRKRKKIKKK